MPRPRNTANVSKARQLRRDMTLSEVLLRNLLRRSPHGTNFRRQHPIGNYVLDFYCAQAKCGFEVDGIAHDLGQRPARDAVRDAALKDLGIEIVRIPAADVLRSAEDVAESIVRYCGG